jgi:hypothetical protein
VMSLQVMIYSTWEPLTSRRRIGTSQSGSRSASEIRSSRSSRPART